MPAPTTEKAEYPWITRLREAGYNVRVGTGEPLEEIPAASFPPRHPSVRERIGGWLIRVGERLAGRPDYWR